MLKGSTGSYIAIAFIHFLDAVLGCGRMGDRKHQFKSPIE